LEPTSAGSNPAAPACNQQDQSDPTDLTDRNVNRKGSLSGLPFLFC
jgi:hypothetical protein